MKIKEDIKYVGVNDHETDLFEGHFIVPNGMAYNSYIILDDKIAIFDTVDVKFFKQWIKNVEEVLNGKKPDYIIVQHMEPDHSANLIKFLELYPDTIVVGNDKTFLMIDKFFHYDIKNRLVVNDGDELSLGKHKLMFVFAPMVHWPEVMVTYDSYSKVLFSADAFGKFGALDVEEDWACEARRYYFGIVGKYGPQVQKLLKQAGALDIQTICPLHGPVLTENLGYYLSLYDTWSSYNVESEGVAIFYTSVYGHTKEAVNLLVKELEKLNCPKIAVTDLAREDMAEAVEDAFRYGKIVLATTTYNSQIFPYMNTFINELLERNFQNREIALIENGTWFPMANKVMLDKLANSKNLTFIEPSVTINSSLDDVSKKQIEEVAKALMNKTDKNSESSPKRKFVCNVCGYVFEGDELPEDFKCPLCGQPASNFREEK